MILAIDSYYYSDIDCYTVGISFDTWEQSTPTCIRSCHTSGFSPYVPGEFYKRELPGILGIIQLFDTNPDIIVVDSFITLEDMDGNIKEGLGAHLLDSLNYSPIIVGVAKSMYCRCNEISLPLRRGNAINPIWIQGLGCTNEEALSFISRMHGVYRIPDLLKLLDKETKKYR